MLVALITPSRVRRLAFGAVLALVLLNGADVWTTHVILAHGAVEADPLSRLLLNSGTLLMAKLAILGLLGVRVLNARPRLGVMAALCFAAGVYATAVLSNLLVLRLVG